MSGRGQIRWNLWLVAAALGVVAGCKSTPEKQPPPRPIVLPVSPPKTEATDAQPRPTPGAPVRTRPVSRCESLAISYHKVMKRMNTECREDADCISVQCSLKYPKHACIAHRLANNELRQLKAQFRSNRCRGQNLPGPPLKLMCEERRCVEKPSKRAAPPTKGATPASP